MADNEFNPLPGVGVRGDRIRITFHYEGLRCRETLEIPVTDRNIKYAHSLVERIKKEIAANVFNYGEHFPDSPRIRKLGGAPAHTVTFEEYSNRYLAAKTDIKSAVLDDYKSTVEKLWLPKLGHLKAGNITNSILQKAISEVDWRSGAHRNNALIPLRGVLGMMFDDEAINKNLAELIKNVSYQSRRPDPLTFDESLRVTEWARKNKGEAAANVLGTLIHTGVRPGEVILLEWANVDFRHRLLNITRTAGHTEQDIKTFGEQTKTGIDRVVEISNRAVSALRRQQEITGDKEHVFICENTGAPYASHAHIRTNIWNPALEGCEMRHRNFYQTRHTYATLALMAGATPAWIANQLGHTTPELVYSTYARWIKGADKSQQLSKLDACYGDEGGND